MRPLVAGLGGGIALLLLVGSANAAPREPAKKPVAAPSAKVTAAKPAKRSERQPAKGRSEITGKTSRKPGSERGTVDPDVRATIAGELPPVIEHVSTRPAEVTTPRLLDTSARRDLDAMREADGFLFPSPPGKATTAVPAPSVGVDASQVDVSTTGLPPTGSVAQPETSSDRAWLSTLTPPDLPFRWDARLVRYLDYFKNNANGRAMVADLLKRSGRYVDEIQKKLRARGLPEDVAWLALIESGMDPRISSRAGAAGLWQFMPKAATAYGLHVDRWVDERLDPERSTDAALDYLSDLHTRFGRWELAFAAYNMGYGGLLTAIRKYDTNDYWDLSSFEDGVPYETALYVPKILALAFVAHNRSAFGLEGLDLDPPEPFVPVAKQRPSLANAPNAKGTHPAPPAPAHPAPAAAAPPTIASSGLHDGPTREVTLRWGESLEALAADHGTTEARIRLLNGLTSPVPPRPGTVLSVPANGSPVAPTERFVAVVPPGVVTPPEKKRILYEVVWGDQLEDVARALGVSSGELCAWNDIDPSARLHGKMVLEAFVSRDQKLDAVRYVPDANADVLAVGSPSFFDYFESKNGRKRVTVTAAKGDTWATIAKKNGITIGLLERINQRSHLSKLTAGEQIVVYTRNGDRVPSKPPQSEDASLAVGADPYAGHDDDTAAMIDAPQPTAVGD